MGQAPLPRNVLVASTVGWLLGCIFLLISLAVAIPAVATRNLSWVVFLPIPFAISYCAAGYLLRKGRRIGAVTGLVASSIYVVLLLLASRGAVTVAFVVHLLFLLVSVGALRALSAERANEPSEGAVVTPPRT
jgi:hypothetical protein